MSKAAPADPLGGSRCPASELRPSPAPAPSGSPTAESSSPRSRSRAALQPSTPGSSGSLTGFPGRAELTPLEPGAEGHASGLVLGAAGPALASSPVLSGAALGGPGPQILLPRLERPPLSSSSLEMERGLRGWGPTTPPAFSVLCAKSGKLFFSDKRPESHGKINTNRVPRFLLILQDSGQVLPTLRDLLGACKQLPPSTLLRERALRSSLVRGRHLLPVVSSTRPDRALLEDRDSACPAHPCTQSLARHLPPIRGSNTL